VDADLKKVFKDFESLYPYPALSDEAHLTMSLDWLAHTHNLLDNKGFPNKFNLMHDYGLGPSYPETTGYTLCTLLTILRNKPTSSINYKHVCAMTQSSAKYLMNECQLADGSFTGGHKKLHNFMKPSVFNTGQILLGLTDLYETLKENNFEFKSQFDIPLDQLASSIDRSATFLAGELTPEGAYDLRYSFAKTPSPYYAKSTSGLLRAGIVLEKEAFITASKKNFDWVLTQQEPNGWINNWGLNGEWALLHRTAYTLRGMIEAYLYYEDEKYLQCVLDGIDCLRNIDRENFSHPELVPSFAHKSGKYRNELCLTGLSQLAIAIAKIPSDHRTVEVNKLYDEILVQTKKFQCRGFKNDCINGGIPASYPINGTYSAYDLIEWGVKFFMDTVLLGMGVAPKEIKG